VKNIIRQNKGDRKRVRSSRSDKV